MEGAWRYALKRATRIYIPYLPVSAVIIAAYVLFPTLSQAPRDWGWLTSLFLVPTHYQPALFVAWTLVFEMVFYTVFVTYFVSRALFLCVVASWAGAILLLPQSASNPSAALLLDPLNFEFMMGLACAVAYRCVTPRFGLALILIGVVVATLHFVLPQMSRLVFGAGAAFVILGAALAEPLFLRFLPAPLIRLGDASYALYLTHNPVISVAARVSARVALLDIWPTAFLFVTGCAVAVGIAYHQCFERPALRLVRIGLISPQSRPPQSVPVA